MTNAYNLDLLVDDIVRMYASSSDDGLNALESFVNFLVASKRYDDAFRVHTLIREKEPFLEEMTCLYLVRSLSLHDQVMLARRAAEYVEACGPMNHVSEPCGGFNDIAAITQNPQDIDYARQKIEKLTDIEDQARALLSLLEQIRGEHLTVPDVEFLRMAIDQLAAAGNHFSAWSKARDLALLTLNQTDLGIVCREAQSALQKDSHPIPTQLIQEGTGNLFRRWPDKLQALRVAGDIADLRLRHYVLAYLRIGRPGNPKSSN